jgi:transposase
MMEEARCQGNLSNGEREKIIYYKGLGRTNREIARIMKRSHTCVNNTIRDFFSEPKSTAIERNPETERKLLVRQYILTETLRDRFLSCRELSARIQIEFNIPCGKSEVARVRCSEGLKHRWAKKTEYLSPRHIQMRLHFAQVIQHHPAFQFPWIISDESSFVLCPMRKKLYRFRGENSACVFQQFQGYPVKCMVWGAIGPGYKSPLIWFKEYITSKTYIAMLKEHHIFEDLDRHFGERAYVFQQDGARPHTARESLDFLRDRALMLPPEAPWPPCSPDLSPIEQIWGCMKHKVRPELATDQASLFAQISKIWDDIPIRTVDNYMRSLKPRIWVMQDLDGGSITGRNDMIQAYENDGIAGRARARSLRPKGCLEVEDVSEWGAVIRDTLKSLLAHGWSPELQAHLEKVHDMLVTMHCSFPGNQ